VILKGPWHRGASLAVLYGSGRFFPSSQTGCPIVHINGGGVDLYATLLRA
jgi:hypothetical protein